MYFAASRFILNFFQPVAFWLTFHRFGLRGGPLFVVSHISMALIAAFCCIRHVQRTLVISFHAQGLHYLEQIFFFASCRRRPAVEARFGGKAAEFALCSVPITPTARVFRPVLLISPRFEQFVHFKSAYSDHVINGSCSLNLSMECLLINQ